MNDELHPKFADRLARRVHVTKQQKGIGAAGHLVNRMMAGYGKDSEARKLVLERVNYWRERAAIGVKVTDK